MAIDFKKFIGANTQTPTQQSGGIQLSKFLPSMTAAPAAPGALPKSYQQGFMEDGKFVTKTITPDTTGVIKSAGPDTRSFVQKVQDSYNMPTITPADKAGNVIDTALNEGRLPYGFDWIRKVAKAGYESVTGSVKNAATGLGQIVDATSKIPLDAYQYQPGFSSKLSDGSPNPDFDKEMKANADYLKANMKNKLQRGTAMAEGVVKIGSLYFTQMMAELQAAKELPGPLSWPAKGIDWAFMKVGEGGAFVADKGIDYLPVSDETKETIRPLANELGAFVAQLVGVKLAHKVAEKGLGGKKGEDIPVTAEFTEGGQKYVLTEGGDVLTKADYAKRTGQTGVYKNLPFSEQTKGKLSEGTKVSVGLAMNPFSTAFSLANAKIMTKVAERKAKNVEITPEEGKRIIEEVKRELPAELGLKELPKNPSEGLAFKPHEIADAAVGSAPETMTFKEAESLVNAKFSPEDAKVILQDLPEKVQNHQATVSTQDLKRKIEMTGVQREREGSPLKMLGQEKTPSGDSGAGINFKKLLQNNTDQGVELASAKLANHAKYYQRDGGYSAGRETPSPFLRDINEIVSTKEGRQAGQRTVQDALAKGQLKLDKNGDVVIYRVGSPSRKNPLVSATYDKGFAEQFSEAVKGAPIHEVKVKPEDIAYVIGGVEKEVLIPRLILKDAMRATETVPVKEGTAPLKPVGGGEKTTSGLAKSIEAKAVEEGLIKSLGDLPELKTADMKQQAEMAIDLLNRNPELARKIALGQEQAPKGMIPEAVLKAVEDRALMEGDVQTIRDLAHGGLVSEARAMGQRLRTLAERAPDGPVEAIQGVEKAREEAVARRDKNITKTKQKIKEEIKQEIKKTRAPKETWDSFVENLTC